MKLETLPQGVRLAVEAIQEKKAAGITVLDLSAVGAFTDYFVVWICRSRFQRAGPALLRSRAPLAHGP